jgi:hypothetical protein
MTNDNYSHTGNPILIQIQIRIDFRMKVAYIYHIVIVLNAFTKPWPNSSWPKYIHMTMSRLELSKCLRLVSIHILRWTNEMKHYFRNPLTSMVERCTYE